MSGIFSRFFRYLWRGIVLSVLLPLLLACWSMWQVYAFSRLDSPLPERADAVVVLGAAAWDTRPSPVFRERINHALALYQTGRAGKLILTGGTPKPGFMTEAEVAKRFALKQGVPENDIVFETLSKDTYQNLVNTRYLMQRHHLGDVVIVSDPYHMARAMAIAGDLGIKAYPSPTPTSRFLDADHKTKLKFFVEESYSLAAYRLLFWGKRSVRKWNALFSRTREYFGTKPFDENPF